MKNLLPIFAAWLLLVSCDSDTKAKNQIEQSTNQVDESNLLLHVPSPEWQDQIIYFLMTDRFNDGDPSNNDQGAGEYNPSKESHYSGGDLQGVIEQLDYIQNLGATAVWTTPVVANQWWSTMGNYGGYHGYWATDFSAVDAHLGTIDTYKKLSDQLHRRGMYLIQDIVVNHTGNFFNYKNGVEGYDPKDSAKNFFLMEQPDSRQPAPVQAPFDLIDRHNPAHVAANIYNWTPSIQDYKNIPQQYTYQLSTLADINTKNPLVIDKFKQIYGDWIKEVGVDAFRIDTVKYVEHEFFHQFMHDPDGIHAVAKSTGREHFLAFGEVFDTSKPYQNDAEHRVASYLGSQQQPELNSLISFPLHHELKTVFAQGFPTDHLAYRIEQHMQVYDNPYLIPTFIDNHDMGRFLASGDLAGFKQALATILTIPGIPTIYQGSAQAMHESRQAMFKGGFMAEQDYFNQDAELYKFIAKLAKIRTSDKLFTRGTLKIVAADKNGAGLLAYKREYQGRTVLVMFNTSGHPILVNNIKLAEQALNLRAIYGDTSGMVLDPTGYLTTELPARSIIIAELENQPTETPLKSGSISITTAKPNTTMTQDFMLSGRASFANSHLLLVKNSRLDTAIKLTTDSEGNWQIPYPVNNLGQEQVSLVAYHPATGTTSQAFSFTTFTKQPEHTFTFTDAIGDDTGLNGKLSAPTHSQSIGQQDILAVKAEIGGEVLKLTFTMKELTNDWLPANGFDNVAFTVFFDLANQAGAKALPMLNANMPNNWNWDLGHVAYGWGNSTFSTQGANAQHQGKKFGVAPVVTVDKAAKTLSFSYRASDFNVQTWLDSNIYLTTWDITGEGAYRDLALQPSPWSFGGGQPDDAKILDFIEMTLKSKE
ncbi:alpha-amylase family glycosyl hydrolase [Paraglaciecola aestuariivivens]